MTGTGRGRRARERRLEPALGEHGGVDAAGELAQLGGGGGQVVDRLVEQLGRERRVGVELAAREPQREREADEVLLGAVVEVALDPPPARRRRPSTMRARDARSSASAREPVGDVAEVAEEDRRAAVLARESR